MTQDVTTQPDAKSVTEYVEKTMQESVDNYANWLSPKDVTTQPASPWQVIETAPKDGTRIWLFWPEAHPDDRQTVGWWENTGYNEPGFIDHCDREFNGQPSRWMPLPPPPEASHD